MKIESDKCEREREYLHQMH